MIRLTIVKPDRQTITIDQTMPAELTVGRSTDSNICLDFDSVASRNHAVFIVNPPEIAVKDLYSTNGIVVNGEKFVIKPGEPNEPIALGNGDQVVIGQTKFKVSIPGRTERTKRIGTRRPLTTHGKDTRTRTASTSTRHFRPKSDENVSPVPNTAYDLPPVTPAVPGWVLTRHIASGTTGNVYLGEEPSGAKRAAIKVMGFGLSLSRSVFDILREEVDEARQARHAGIATVTGMGELSLTGGAYLAYEYVQALTLAAHQTSFEKSRIPYKQAFPLMKQLTETVCFLHRRDDVHMDLKPASVLLLRQDGKLRAKLTDHGYFKFLDSSGLVPRGRPIPTMVKLGYTAPEETNPEMEASPAADVFALTAIFYSMLTGKSPYRFAPGRDSLKVVQDGWMQPIEEALPELPISLVVVIERGLSVDPYSRYSTACELLEGLEACF